MNADPSGITLAVLAGGMGRRMGGPKDRVTLGGEPVLERLLGKLEWGGPTLLVVGAGIDPRTVIGSGRFSMISRDAVANEGPVRGVLTALEAAITRWVLVVPTDMPGLSLEQLEWLCDQRRDGDRGVMVSRSAAPSELRVEPFPLLLDQSFSQDLDMLLQQGERAMRILARMPRIRVVDAPGEWDARVWANLNTPADVSEWNAAAVPADHDL